MNPDNFKLEENGSESIMDAEAVFLAQDGYVVYYPGDGFVEFFSTFIFTDSGNTNARLKTRVIDDTNTVVFEDTSDIPPSDTDTEGTSVMYDMSTLGNIRRIEVSCAQSCDADFLGIASFFVNC